MAFTLVKLPSLAEEVSDTEEAVPLEFGPRTFFASPFEDDDEEYLEEATAEDVMEVDAATVQQVLDNEKLRQETKAGTRRAQSKIKMKDGSGVSIKEEAKKEEVEKPLTGIAAKRAKKNNAARKRAAMLNQQVEAIQQKPESERTEEEKSLLAKFNARRDRKNKRSKERTIEKMELVNRILAKPENQRTEKEKKYVKTEMERRAIKNQRDRERRQRQKRIAGLLPVTRVVNASSPAPSWESYM